MIILMQTVAVVKIRVFLRRRWRNEGKKTNRFKLFTRSMFKWRTMFNKI